MNEQRDDMELKRYLDGGSGESRAYAELGDEAPPPELDARILAEAESAVKVTELDSRRAPPFKAFAWAAIVVLSFSLVLNIVFEQGAQDPVAELESMAKRSAAPAILAESKDAEERVVTARKMARARPESEMELSGMAESGTAGSTMVESDQPVGSLDRDPGIQGRLLELRSQTVKMARSEEEFADEPASREAPAAVVAIEPPPPAVDLQTPTGIDSDALEPTMQVVAEFLSETASAGRSDTVASAAPDAENRNTELERILNSFNEGDREDALKALAEFRDAHPEHPVSVTLKERGF